MVMESNKQSQISMSSEDFQGVLESIGYNLIDCGDHWRTQALYRDGDNKTAVKIYKNTGVWMDFVESRGSLPFEALNRLKVKDQKQVKEKEKKLKDSKLVLDFLFWSCKTCIFIRERYGIN